MSAIEAASVGVKTMADGTLRVTFDVEPRHAKDAFALFGAPGTPAALAALKAGHAAKSDTPAEKPKGGELAKLAGIWCNDERFQEWMAHCYADAWKERCGLGPNLASAHVVRVTCGVESRAELDSDPQAAERFHAFIRGPYSKHLIAMGVTA